MKRKIRFWLLGGAGCLILAAGLFALSDGALAKPPEGKGGGGKGGGGGGGGGGTTEITLARIQFVEESGIRSDGQATCTDVDLGDVWDYWDIRDPVLVPDPDDPDGCGPFASRIDVSGGGRVKFFTTEGSRWLTLDFSPPFLPDESPFDLDGDQDGDGIPDGPNIDDKVYPETVDAPPINPDTFVDNVKATITMDSMFKKSGTRQPLDLTIRRGEGEGWGPAGWSLHSMSDLYIVNDPNDKDVRTLTTRNPQTGEHDSAWFELWQNGETVGIYYFPLTWEMRMVR